MKGIAKFAKLAVMLIDFLKRLEEILDPDEKSTIEDAILEALGSIAERLAEE